MAGSIGERELVNRSIIKLKQITVTPAEAVSGNPSIECIGIINPISATDTSPLNDLNWTTANTLSVPGAGSYFQPTFAQTAVDARVPEDGQIVFRFFVSSNEPTVFDLSDVRELQNSIFGGDQRFPDGPDVLCILFSNTSPNANANNLDVSTTLQWQEAQA